MCLLIEKPANVGFDKSWLRDFYHYNRDGVGIMRAHNGKVIVEKVCAPSVDAWLAFYQAHARGHACFIHLRMRTHGHINKDNTHPYHVGHGIWLMHNGVLSQGNAKDTTKSDTWHFINDVLAPMVEADRDALKKPLVQAKIARMIGSNNRFAILHPDGTAVVINRHTGVRWGGAWLSNTYAWTSSAAEFRRCWHEETQPLPKKKLRTKKVHDLRPAPVKSTVVKAKANKGSKAATVISGAGIAALSEKDKACTQHELQFDRFPSARARVIYGERF